MALFSSKFSSLGSQKRLSSFVRGATFLVSGMPLEVGGSCAFHLCYHFALCKRLEKTVMDLRILLELRSHWRSALPREGWEGTLLTTCSASPTKSSAGWLTV